MEALKILAIQERYMNDPAYSYVQAAFDLVAEGCNHLEASKLLLQVDSFLDQEEEINEFRPGDCICADKTFEVYGCMCRERRMPG
jgi:hypothetical protein